MAFGPPAMWSLILAGFLVTGCTAPPASDSGDGTLATDQSAFLDTLSRRSFDYFWELTDPNTGLTPDRAPTQSFSSIAAIGFALTAYPVGVEHRWITRDAARQRVLTTLRFLWHLPQGDAPSGMGGYHGFFYHFLNPGSGTRFQQVELSTIDTSLLLLGALFCGQYFTGSDPGEVEIRALADSLYRRVDWTWIQPRPPLVSMGWTPEEGFHSYDWKGYDEAMLLYVLALGSPTHPIDAAAWPAWTASSKCGTFEGREQVGFAPLFGHQYSQVWIDFRGIEDAYMRAHGLDYFENSRRATLSQRDYAIANPMHWKGYDSLSWGLSASDGPADMTLDFNGQPRRFQTYSARGASHTEVRDDGTITPHAAGGSIAFAPEVVVPTLMAIRSRLGDNIFSRYGFLDAYNESFTFDGAAQQGRIVPGQGWFDTDYIGIDVGPTLLMTENLRTGLIWKLMRNEPSIRRGLLRAGFTGGWLGTRSQ
jgi:hypothetical protein